MSAPYRRKGKKRFITFVLVFEVQEMVVQYQPNWASDVGLFEFRSLHEPPERIPLSETGYYSHFAQTEAVEAWPTPQDYAREIVLTKLRAHQKTRANEADQLWLF